MISRLYYGSRVLIVEDIKKQFNTYQPLIATSSGAN
jgi:hypothetical protein